MAQIDSKPDADAPLSFAQVDSILDELLSLPAHEREAFLNSRCAGDNALRRELESLLAFATDARLVTGGARRLLCAARTDRIDTLGPGSTVGAYELGEQIGAGGMSRVYKARRTGVDFDQVVAIKVMRSLGGDDGARASRFMTERRVLASLTHPNISRIIDGGITASDRPYLVMEYVNGTSITEHCRANALPVRDRIDLFIDACAAVQHAHSKLVVHRDIKPTNILVDQHGCVKLLDFGIAKLLDDTQAAAQTQTGLFLFTPDYAAPEQMTGRPITPATDIYALGVLLYELITDRRLHQLSSASVADQLKRVCESLPSAPSTQLGDARTLAQLTALQSSDLDLMTLKLLAKEPEARYGSCVELVQDLERWRDGLPIHARAPSRRYRVHKWIARNRLLATSLALGVLVLASFLTALVAERRVTRIERDRAVQAEAATGAINEFLIRELLDAATPEYAQGDDLTVKEVLDRASRNAAPSFADQPLLEASVRTTLGRSFLRLGRLDDAASNLDQAAAIVSLYRDRYHTDQLAIDLLAAELDYERGQLDAAGEKLEALIMRQRRALGPSHLQTLRSRTLLARVHHGQARWDDAERLLKQVVAEYEREHPDAHGDRIQAYRGLISVHREQRRTPEAVAASERLIDMQRAAFGDRHPGLVPSLVLHARLLEMHEKDAAALVIAEEAHSLANLVFEDGHTQKWKAANMLAILQLRARRYHLAEPIYRNAITEYTTHHSSDHPAVVEARSNLAVLLSYMGQFDESIALNRDTVEHYARSLGERHPTTTRQIKNLIRLLGETRRFDERRQLTARMAGIARSFVSDEVRDAVVMSDMADFLLTCLPPDLRDPDAAYALAQRAVALSDQTHIAPLMTLALALDTRGDVDAAIAINETVARRPDALHIHSLVRDLSSQYLRSGRLSDGEKFFREHISRREAARAADDPLIAIARLEFARFLIQAGRPERAAHVARSTRNQLIEISDRSDNLVARANAILGGALLKSGSARAAESLLLDSYASLKTDAQARTPVKTEILDWLTELYRTTGRSTEANHMLAERRTYDGVPE